MNGAVAGQRDAAVAAVLARAGYVAIPLRWTNGDRSDYLYVEGTVDTARVAMLLDTGNPIDALLDTSLNRLRGVHRTNVRGGGSFQLGSLDMWIASVNRLTLGPLALGTLLTTMLPSPHRAEPTLAAIGHMRGLIGAPLLSNRGAIVDLETDTLYLLATPAPAPTPAVAKAANLRAALEADGRYRTFLALAREAGLMPLLDGTAPTPASPDSIAWGVLYQWGRFRPEAIERADTEGPIASKEFATRLTVTIDRQLRQAGQLTAFVPTDSAFAQLPPDTLRALRADRARLTHVLRAHLLLDARLDTSALYTLVGAAVQPDGPVLSFPHAEKFLAVERQVGQGEAERFVRAAIVRPDLVAVNGVAHGIDRVLISSPTPLTPLAEVLTRQGYVALPMHRQIPSGHYYVYIKVNGKPAKIVVDTGDTEFLSLDAAGSAAEDSVSVPVESLLDIRTPEGLEEPAPQSAEGPATHYANGMAGSALLREYHARMDFATNMLYLLPPAAQRGQAAPASAP